MTDLAPQVMKRLSGTT